MVASRLARRCWLRRQRKAKRTTCVGELMTKLQATKKLKSKDQTLKSSKQKKLSLAKSCLALVSRHNLNSRTTGLTTTPLGRGVQSAWRDAPPENSTELDLEPERCLFSASTTSS